MPLKNLKKQLETGKKGCVNCGKCCQLDNQAPFILPVDVRRWIKFQLWDVMKEVRFTHSRKEGMVDIKCDECALKKMSNGVCVFKIGDECEAQTLEQQWTFRTKSRDNLECIWREKGKCQIYSVRPLACTAYPLGFKCLNKRIVPVKKTIRLAHYKAYSEWIKAPRKWRQDKLKEIHKVCKINVES